MELEKKVEQKEYIFGPNTAGLAQRIYNSNNEVNDLYILKKAYITKCSQNQF